ncbi:LysR family transcriptional regulator [Novosphingobium sp. G106]|uniref:LysR family transcriptional regulator n=1 Tax=Novosphingobium sp. G106 TaxID=2849500 RepID=UPI001C2CD591|nr:LysR family transcriptional regulator [Novosphingobium sp. G106]MBV1690093.1 LysR family transcriptional regulator [Novosphingobium sp. G106]
MELRRLRYFLQVAREGSLGQASRSLGVAQPALGRQIQLLEAELGVRLFERMARGMRLTDEGEYLREALGDPLQQLDLALKNVRSFAARVDVSFTMGLPPGIAQLLGPRIYLRLARELPNLKLRFVESDSASLAADLLRGLVDIALLAGVTPDDRVFRSEVLREELLLVGAPGSALSGRGSVAFAELENFPLILPSPPDGLPTLLEKLAARGEAKLTMAGEVDSIDLARDVVKAGAGFTFLPPLACREAVARGELVAASVTDPAVDRMILYAVQPLWRVPRSTYNEVERVIFAEWSAVVTSGAWPAEWLFDPRLLSTYAG